jgi:2-aminoadipate transaminase
LLEFPGEDVLITSGCQQALDLIARAFCGFGDAVLVEDPVYAGLRNVFARHQARLTGLPVGARGIDPDAFAQAIERERPRLALVCPDFQNPTGATLPLAARQSIGEAAARANVPLVEIDIYRDLRYRGAPMPTIKELVPAAHVLLVRSFSKVAFPGLRTGWIQAPRASIAKLAEMKQWTDLHSDQFSQAIMLRFLESGRLARHRERMIRAGAASLDALLEAAAQHLPAGTQVTQPEGGMSVWVTLPAPLQAEDLLVTAKRLGVTYLPGSFFAVNRPCPSSLRLSFAGLAPDLVRQGVMLLGRACHEESRRERLMESPAVAMV